MNIRVAASSDDAEEKIGGGVSLTSSDLELVFDSGGDQVVGMRFNGINIPPEAIIINSYIQFQVDEINTVATSLTIQGEDVDNAATFISSSWNISSRPWTTAAVSWSPVAWSTKGEAGVDQQTPDISSIIQEIVNRPGWMQNNSLVVIISGTGERTAEAYDGDQAGAPLLHVDYMVGVPPQVTITNPPDGTTFIQGDVINFTGTATDSENEDIAANIFWKSNIDGNIGTGGSFSHSNLSYGVHTIEASAIDSIGLTGTDQISISVTTSEGNLPPVVSTGPDQIISLFVSASLDGTISDDGMPSPPGIVTTSWSLVSGPGSVTFADSSVVDTVASFSAAGTYSLELTADDGELISSDQITIDVIPTPIIQVPQDQPTIQGGIDAAQDGDLVLVSPGIYNETLNISGKTITLASLFHTTQDASFIDQTVIDGGNQTVITFTGSAEIETRIIGFTIQNGLDGISAKGKIDILNNRFTGNADGIDYEGGGGICRNNLFEYNTDDAIDLDGSTEAIIENNIIRNNGDDGIEIRLHEYTGPTLNIIIRNNLISGNNKDGIQLIDYPDVSDRFFLIEDNLIEANLMSGLGLMDGGLTKEDFRAASIPERIHLFNNTFTGNGHALTGGDNLIALNNLFVNSTNIGIKGVDGTSIAAYNLFWNNGIDIQDSVIDANSTLFNDPLLDANYQLQLASPAIDAGTAFFEWQGETVLDLPSSAYYGAAPDLGLNESIFGQVNNPPVAFDDAYATGEDELLIITAPGVLGNDSDEDGNSLTPILDTAPTYGSLTLNPDGAFTYSPDLNFNGSDSFTYLASDGIDNSNVATVTITVNPVNDAPVVTISAPANGQIFPQGDLITLTGNASDVEDGDVAASLIWVSDQDGIIGSGPSSSTNTLSTGVHKITATAIDSGGLGGSDHVAIAVNGPGNDSPKTTITAPADGSTITQGDSVNFTGTALDPEDGDVTASMAWESDVNGPIGTGGNSSRSDLSLGAHIITATVTDSGGLTAFDNISINIESNSAVLVGAGDIAKCSYDSDEETAKLLDNIPGTVFTLGDNVYPDGTDLEFNDCYEPTWGRHKDRTRPAAGNHEYRTPGASGYFNYFGAAAGEVGKGYYSYDIGDWHIIALNSKCSEIGGCGASSPQGLWLQADLAANPRTCTLAYWHKPLFVSESNHGGSSSVQDFWSLLYEAKADIVLNGHNHNYERFAPQTPLGVVDPDNGIREFVVGTGGAGLYDITSVHPNSEVSESNTHGVLKLTLKPTSYDWEFIPIAGQTFTDSGTADCVPLSTNNPPVATDDAYSTDEDTLLSVGLPGVLGNDSDLDGDPLTAVLENTTSNGTLTLSTDGSFSYTPNANFFGTDSFTYFANDGTVNSTAVTVTITINPVNDQPVATTDGYTTDEDTLLNVGAPGVLGNDSDVDGDMLNVVLENTTSNGTLTLSSDGSFTYSPDPNFNGSDSFTYRANDGFEDSNASTVTIIVNPINYQPVAADDAYSTDEDGDLTVAAPGVLGNDSDLDGDPLSAVLENTTSNGTLTPNADGSFTYSPNPNFFGTDSFTYFANDGTVNSAAAATVTITVLEFNNAPVGVGDNYATNEDTPLSVGTPGVLGNDSDIDGDLLTAVLENTTSNGTLTLNSNGSFTYTPSPNFNGADSFTYLANDGLENSNVATATITVNAVNDQPVAAADTYSTDEDVQLNVAAPGVLGNDSDVDGDTLTATLVTTTSNGTLTLNSNGSFTYTPSSNFFGMDSFTYLSNDGLDDSNVATVTITVNAVNDQPVAADDAYSTDEDAQLIIAMPGALFNDSDVDGDTLTATLVTTTSNGTLTLNSNGSFTYTPSSNFFGMDSFTYLANDGLDDSNVATVTITVNAVNDQPVAADDAYSTDEDAQLIIAMPGALFNDSDVDGDTLTATLVTTTSNGTLTLNPNGSFSYSPALNFNSADSFTYLANDGMEDSNAATVNITVNPVNDAPVADANGSYTGTVDVLLQFDGSGSSDVDGTITSYDWDFGDDSSGSGINPSHTYAAIGSYTVVLIVTDDGGTTATDTTNANILAEPNNPPAAAADAYSTDEDVQLNIAAPGVLGNDSDVDGDSLTAVLMTTTNNGTLTLNSNGSFTYIPGPNFNGSDSFTYLAYDGLENSNVATAIITVNAINDQPVADDDAYSIDEDAQLIIAAPGVLSNDSDADGDTLTVTLVTTTSNGTLTLNSNGSFSYSPALNFNGADSFTYLANDGMDDSNAATVNITVNPVNDAPVSDANGPYTGTVDVLLQFDGSGSSDVDGTITSYDWDFGDDSSGSGVNPTHTYAAVGSYTVVLTVTDDGGTTATDTTNANILAEPNNPPAAAADAYSTDEDVQLNIAAPGVLSNDSDVDGDSLTAVLITTTNNGTLTLNSNGSFTYITALNFFGMDSFTYLAYDGLENSNVATATITVNTINDQPVADDDPYSTDEDVQLNVAAPGVLGNDSDVDGDSLTVTLVTTTNSGTLTLNPNGSFTYIPDPNFNGSDSFTYLAYDGLENSNVATATISVNTINDTPVADDDAYSIDEDIQLNVAAPGVLSNDSDVDDDSLTATLVTTTSNGTLTLNSDGSFTYSPALNFNGTDSFTYLTNDSQINSNVATVIITVNPVNDPPVAADDAYSTDEDVQLTIAAPGVLGNDSDVDGDTLTVVLVSTTTNGNLTLNSNGSFTYIPGPNFNGSDSFTYLTYDGLENSNVATATISVNTINDQPVADDDPYSIDEDIQLNVAAPGVLGNDSDVDGDTLTATLVTTTSNGTLTLNSNGSFTYTPGPNFNGADSFTYLANDGLDDSTMATVTITVNAVNDQPVADDDPFSTDEDVQLNVAAPGVLGNDSDVDGDTLTATLMTTTSNGTLTLNSNGSFTYTPNPNFNGTDSFTYRANDGLENSNVALVIITVNAVNDPPVAAANAYSTDEDVQLNVGVPGVLFNDYDVDGDSLTAVLITTTNNGTLTLNPNGSFSYTPSPNFNGTDSFTYLANDGLDDSNMATVTITVNAVNDQPVSANDPYSTDEDVQLNITAPGVLDNDSDVDGNSLSAILNTSPTNGIVNLNADGSFTYTPSPNFNGTDSFTYRADDGLENSNAALVIITVNAVNDPPQAADDTGAVTQGGTLNQGDPGVLSNDSDPEDDALAVKTSPVNGPNNGTLTLIADGSYIYIHDGSATTSDSFVYQVCDTELLCDTATVNITITSSSTTTFEVRVAASSDDAEEHTSGRVGVNNNDLELVFDKVMQTVGIRFNNVTIPYGANISSAFIQFQADETHSMDTTLNIKGQANGNVLTFVNSTNNITSRFLTTASVYWTPVPWTTKGDAGPDQQTADIASVIQEIVNRTDWSEGNSLVIIITGTDTGKRVAESYNGDQAGAPLLHVEYNTGS